MTAIVIVAAAASGSRCAPRRAEPLRIFVPQLPERLDPYGDSRFVSRVLAVNVFEPLVRVDAAGEPAPALAASWTNSAQERWVFRLRTDARFSDGSPVTASEVVRSFDRARATGSLVAGSLAGVRDVRAEDESTVSLTAQHGSRRLLQSLTAVFISREVTDAGGGSRLIGSGPYEVTRLGAGARVDLRASEGRRGPAPHLAAATWIRFASSEEVRAGLATGPAVVIDPPAEALAAARADRRLKIASEFNGVMVYLAFGLGRRPGGKPRPFADVRTRRAVRLALDVRALAVAASAEGAVEASQVIPPGVHGYDPGLRPLRRDLAAAKKLLSRAPVVGRVTLDAVPASERLAAEIAMQLGEAGLLVDVNLLPSYEFQLRIEGQSDAYVYNWVLGDEAGEALERFFHTKDVARGLGLRNRIGYSNPAFDAAVERASAASRPDERLPPMQEAARVLDRDLPWVPLFAPRSVRIHPADLAIRFRTDGMLVLAEIEPARAP